MADRLFDPLAEFRLDDQVAVVVGGANGIGRAIADAYAGVGAIVAIVDRDLERAHGAAAALCSAGATAEAYPLDVTDSAEIERVFEGISRQYGRFDVLVNSAGVALREPAIEVSAKDWQTVVDVNLTGLFFCARTGAKKMMAAARGGRIVNIASIMGVSGGGLYPNASYQATKGAVVNLTRALAIEWAEAEIRVNAIAPTYVRTNFIRGLLDQPDLVAQIEAMTPLRRLADPADITGAAIYLASAASRMVTGHILPVDGGFLAQ